MNSQTFNLYFYEWTDRLKIQISMDGQTGSWSRFLWMGKQVHDPDFYGWANRFMIQISMDGQTYSWSRFPWTDRQAQCTQSTNVCKYVCQCGTWKASAYVGSPSPDSSKICRASFELKRFLLGWSDLRLCQFLISPLGAKLGPLGWRGKSWPLILNTLCLVVACVHFSGWTKAVIFTPRGQLLPWGPNFTPEAVLML
jgi:hypothetical protein